MVTIPKLTASERTAHLQSILGDKFNPEYHEITAPYCPSSSNALARQALGMNSGIVRSTEDSVGGPEAKLAPWQKATYGAEGHKHFTPIVTDKRGKLLNRL